MSVIGHITKKIREEGPKETAAGISRALLFRYYTYSPLYQPSSIYDEEWDLCLILDGCRPDALEVFRNDYEFLQSTIPTAWSVAGDSFNWMDATFRAKYADEVRNTIYVTGNPHAERLSEAEFHDIDHVWKYGWDDDLETIPADVVVDRAISHGRESPDTRLIVHLMQPHFPSIPDPIGSGIDIENMHEGWEGNIWQQLKRGEQSEKRVWHAYLQNLNYVLTHVERLLDNIDADNVLLTADHGNAFGNWGVYGHDGRVFPGIREIPWVWTSATDTHIYEPPEYETEATIKTELDEQLSALGYR